MALEFRPTVNESCIWATHLWLTISTRELCSVQPQQWLMDGGRKIRQVDGGSWRRCRLWSRSAIDRWPNTNWSSTINPLIQIIKKKISSNRRGNNETRILQSSPVIIKKMMDEKKGAASGETGNINQPSFFWGLACCCFSTPPQINYIYTCVTLTTTYFLD